MRIGFEKLEKQPTEYELVFRKDNIYYSRTQATKEIMKTWPQSKATLYRKINDSNKWDELEAATGLTIELIAPVGTAHYISTNGDLLTSQLKVVKRAKDERYVIYREEGVDYRVFPALLVIKAFIDSTIDIATDLPYYIDGNYKNPDISNVIVSVKQEKTTKKSGVAASNLTKAQQQRKNWLIIKANSKTITEEEKTELFALQQKEKGE